MQHSIHYPSIRFQKECWVSIHATILPTRSWSSRQGTTVIHWTSRLIPWQEKEAFQERTGKKGIIKLSPERNVSINYLNSVMGSSYAFNPDTLLLIFLSVN
jgi:hypothetical protein